MTTTSKTKQRDRVLRALEESPVPMTPRQLADMLSMSNEAVNTALVRCLLPKYVQRRKSSLPGHPYLYLPVGRGWPPDAPLFKQAGRAPVSALQRKLANARRRGAALGHQEGSAELQRRKRQSKRFPDERFVNYDRSPLTAAERCRLWAWAKDA